MALSRNLAANAGNQLWSFGLNLLALPLYLSLLGPQSYALVGFGLIVQTWATLIDAGMSATLARDMARYRSGEVAASDMRAFLRSLDWLCLGVLLVTVGLGFATRDWWARNWFQAETLPPALIGEGVALIITFSVLRVAAGLYRSGVLGLERQVLANGVSAGATTIRLLAPVPMLAIVPDVRLVFATWAIVSLVELAAFRTIAGAPFDARRPFGRFSWPAVAPRIGLAGGVAFLSVIGIVISQGDKLLLSRLLPLTEFGYFSLGVVIANGVLMLAAPITQAFQPQLTMAAAELQGDRLRALIRGATAIMILGVVTPAVVIAAFPERLFFAWTGNPAAAISAAPYAGLYVLASALAGPAGVAWALQLAFGRIRMHIVFNIVFALLLIPGIYVAANAYGAVGAALLLVAMNLFFLFVYCPVVLGHLLPGETRAWLAEVLLPGGAALTVALAANLAIGDSHSARLQDFLVVTGVGIPAFAAAVLASPAARSWLLARRQIRSMGVDLGA
jgi:O-antigen/teichoic acid export membrane protein